jgi:hypothetical protein
MRSLLFCNLIAVLGLLIVGGCASQPAALPVAPTTVPSLAIPPAAIDERSIEITSDPGAARIIVNGQPVGRAPLQVKLRVTPQGFCSDYITIKARFVAENPTQVSQTIETELTPREKVPAKIFFTRQGAQRLMQ